MCGQGFVEPFDGWRLSLGGTSLSALRNFLERHNGVAKCLVCTDDDEAGRRAYDEVRKIPGITVERILPIAGKDWNEGLLAMQKAKRLQNRANRGAERS
jgi:DNA primase